MMFNRNRRSACYHPERDGSLAEYLELHDGWSSMPLFKGYEQYKMLWDLGYLEPHVSSIRLMWNMGREDEHFSVLGLHEIEGCSELRAHAGRAGIHDPKEVLSEENCPEFEAQTWNRKPVIRNCQLEFNFNN